MQRRGRAGTEAREARVPVSSAVKIMDKVVVVGGHGFLGANIVAAFARQGYHVEVCSRRTGVDARDARALAGFLGKVKPAIVVNCAADTGGIAYNTQRPVTIYEDNLLIGFNLLRASFQCGVRKFVNILPNSTYPGHLTLYTESRWWDGPVHPTMLASAMPRKAQWVQAWSYYQERGFRSIHLVLPNMYGPRDHFDLTQSHALASLIRKVVDAKLQGTNEVKVWGTGKPVRECLYVEDAAEGVLRANENYDEIEILNLGQGEGCSIRGLAELIRELAGWSGEFIFDTSRPDGALCKVMDVQKMKAALNWTPSVPLREGVARTLNWFMENQPKPIAAPTV